MNKKRTGLRFILVNIAVVYLLISSRGSVLCADLEFTAMLEKKTYVMGEGVFATFKLVNNGVRAESVYYMALWAGTIEVDLLDETGKKLPQQEMKYGSNSSHKEKLGPNDTIVYSESLELWFGEPTDVRSKRQFRPGIYTIKAKCLALPRVPLKSQPITFFVEEPSGTEAIAYKELLNIQSRFGRVSSGDVAGELEGFISRYRLSAYRPQAMALFIRTFMRAGSNRTKGMAMAESLVSQYPNSGYVGHGISYMMSVLPNPEERIAFLRRASSKSPNTFLSNFAKYSIKAIEKSGNSR